MCALKKIKLFKISRTKKKDEEEEKEREVEE